jgi:hypothetical protein
MFCQKPLCASTYGVEMFVKLSIQIVVKGVYMVDYFIVLGIGITRFFLVREFFCHVGLCQTTFCHEWFC